MSTRQQRYRSDPEHRAKVLATSRRWLKKHRQQRAAYLAAYRKTHLEEARERSKRWRESAKGKQWSARYFKAYRRKNRAKIAAYNKRYNREHTKARTEHARLYRQAHPEVQRRASKRHRQRHPAKCRQRSRQYWQKAVKKNPHLASERNSRHRCRVAKLPVGRLNNECYKTLKRFFAGRCAYCGKRTRLSIDHLKPLGAGLHCSTNIVPACLHCNRSKSNHRWQAWFRQQKFFSREREKKILLWKQKGA